MNSYLNFQNFLVYIRKNSGRHWKGGRLPTMWIRFLSFISLSLIVGCATPQKAMYVAPAFDQIDVDRITILPIFDARAQRPFEIKESDLQHAIYPSLETGLSQKGYTFDYSTELGRVQCLKYGRSSNLAPDCLRNVGPSNSRWILVLFLQDFRIRSPYGGAVSAKMSGLLFDRSEGVMLWRDLEYSGLSQRELVGNNRDTLIGNDVLQLCTSNLISSVPQKSSTPQG